MNDLISRQAAIDVLAEMQGRCTSKAALIQNSKIWQQIKDLPSAQPEPSIPLSWIEGQIEWLRSLDNAFASMTAGQISAMVEKWKGEQDG